ncbi:putative manganese-dependent inorganic diphosphatase [Ruminococcaceae bacterium OttesenSCG-928-N02]|nr:putative manganese-dependent inorganic diphosphatase [Ruminococcaceae bacterium OttesenSCG-928-N02]
MPNKNKNSIYIIGHKNPDTDSICSAIGYAALKNIMEPENNFIPCRAGAISDETQYALSYFDIPSPLLVEDIGTQVGDMVIETPNSAALNDSISTVWQYMQMEHQNTIPITNGEKLAGLISINDIARSNMSALDNSTLGKANTPFSNIASTLSGEIIIGNTMGKLTGGKILIAAAEPEVLSRYVQSGDLVILGNRTASQLQAIENGAACLVVCTGASVDESVLQAAEKSACAIIVTPHDSYIAARLISHAAPISHFMTKDNLITFTLEDGADEAREVMAAQRHRDFPVVHKGKYVGMVSRQSFFNMRKKRVILVDHNETSQAVEGIQSAEIVEIIDHHRLGDIETLAPLYFRAQPLGCTATIVNQMYEEAGITPEPALAGLLCAAILSDTLFFRSPTSTHEDQRAATKLSAIANIELNTFAHDMFFAGSNLVGKPMEELFETDYKRFDTGAISFGIGQISSMSKQNLNDVLPHMLTYMADNLQAYKVDYLFFMLTDILNESSTLLCCGLHADAVVQKAFGESVQGGSVTLKGVMSRKKQLVPPLMAALQEL